MSSGRASRSGSKSIDGRVFGRVRVRDVQSPELVEVQVITLIAIANDLVMNGARGESGRAGKLPTTLEVKTTLFSSCACETVEGEAVLLHRNAPISIWQCDLRAANGPPLAQVVHTIVDHDRSNSRSMDRPEPIPAPVEAGPRARNADDRRETIARAACKIIAEKGFAAASMREIARAAGMHVPTMYQYVASKEEVLELVYRWVIDRVRDNVRDAFAEDLPPEDRLIGVVRSLVDNNSAMRKESGVLNREMRSLSKEARKRVIKDYADIVDNVSNIIADGIERGDFRKVNPVLIANFIDAICDIYALRHFAVGQFSVDEFKNELANLLQFGLREIQK